jgi:alpha-tubulin suppressor-like RCC1 family protein
MTEDEKVYFTGQSKDFSLPEDRTVDKFTAFKLSQDPLFSDKIVDIACGKQFNVFVTESGKIFGQGNRLLKRFGMESEVPLVLPVKDDAKVLRAWASCATQNQELVIIEVELKDGGIQLWSAGRSEQGLLGQGGKTKETKVFAPLAYDHKNIKFVSISVYTDHAMAIDENGGLWSWGSNL